LGKNINVIKKKRRLDATKEVGLEVKTKKTKCMFISHHYTTAQNHYKKEPIKYFENMTKLKYLETMVQVELASKDKLRTHEIWATTELRIFCLPVCHLKIQTLK
jgi:hypothetical protein